MATVKQLKECAKVLGGMETAVADTFSTQAANITRKLSSVFGRENWAIESADVETMVDSIAESATWKGTTADKVRRSEYRSVIKGYPFLQKGCAYFRSEYGTLGKDHLLKVARLAPQCETAEDAGEFAVEFFQEKDKAKGTGNAATQGDKLVAGLKQSLANTKGSAMQKDLIAFVKKYKLAKKCGVK